MKDRVFVKVAKKIEDWAGGDVRAVFRRVDDIVLVEPVDDGGLAVSFRDGGSAVMRPAELRKTYSLEEVLAWAEENA